MTTDADDRIKRSVLVAGATGYAGRHAVIALGRRGHRVRALVRDEAKLGEARPHADEVFKGEATMPETLAGLCDGVQVVVSALGVRASRGKITHWDVDCRANLTLLELAIKAGVEHFVFVSVLHGQRFRGRVPQIEARERVVDALGEAALASTVIRPTGFFNDMAEFFQMATRGKVWLVGPGKSKINPIHGADLAEVIADAVDDSRGSAGQSIEVGGPEILTGVEIAELAFSALGKPVKLGHVPPWMLRGVGMLAAPFSPNFSNMMKFFSVMADGDAVGACVGEHKLADFYADLAAAGDAAIEAHKIKR